jgi:hypothetical protein
VTRTRRILSVAAPLLGVALVVGCGTQEAGAAAVVGGRRISVDELQNAVRDIQGYVGPDQQVKSEQVLLLLALQPYVDKVAAKAGIGVSESDARAEIVKRVPKAGLAAVRALQASGGIGAIQQLDAQRASVAEAEITDLLRGADVQINPRYGQFDPKALVIKPEQPNWLLTPAPAPSPQPAP